MKAIMLERLQTVQQRIVKSVNLAVECENWDAFDKYSNMVDLLEYIKTGKKPLSTSGIFHII